MVGSGGGNGEILAITPTASFTGARISVLITAPAPSNVAYLVINCAPASQFGDVVVSHLTDHRAVFGQFSRGFVRCPAGYYAFGGGGYFKGGGSAFIGAFASNSSNAPSADGNAWTFAGEAPGGADSMVIITQCAPRTGHDFLVQFGNLAPPGGYTTITSSYVDCPSGYTAIAGGYYVSEPNGTEAYPGTVYWSVPTSHIAGISSWYASGRAPLNDKMVALAQCLRA